MGRKINISIVDAFTDKPGCGSPTGVVMETDGLSEQQMQKIAEKVPASHTCFASLNDDQLTVRFFTSGGEIPNCGHGTIATHYLHAKLKELKGDHSVIQQAKNGLQQVNIHCNNTGTEVFLHQDQINFELPAFGTIPALLEAFQLHTNDILIDPPVMLASPGSNRILLGVRTEEILDSLSPDFDKLKRICNDNESMGCFVYTIKQTVPTPEVAARMFAPAIGVNEDVINGNSSGCLGAFLFFLDRKVNPVLHVHQGKHFNREGIVKVKVQRVNDRVDTIIGGAAVLEREMVLEI